jgi:hypothetical protein
MSGLAFRRARQEAIVAGKCVNAVGQRGGSEGYGEGAIAEDWMVPLWINPNSVFIQ